MVMCRPGWGSGESDNWMSPRVNNTRVEDAAYARAEQALRDGEVKRDAARRFELETRELSAGFEKVEAKEHQQRSTLTAMHQKKQRAVDRHRLRTDDAKYHERSEATPRVGGLPQEPPLAVIVGTSTPRKAALQAHSEAVCLHIAANKSARARDGRLAQEIAALKATEASSLNTLTGASRLSTAPGSARQAQAQVVRGQWSERGERAMTQRREVAKEWERQQELSLRRKGAPQDQNPNPVPNPDPNPNPNPNRDPKPNPNPDPDPNQARLRTRASAPTQGRIPPANGRASLSSLSPLAGTQWRSGPLSCSRMALCEREPASGARAHSRWQGAGGARCAQRRAGYIACTPGPVPTRYSQLHIGTDALN